MKKRGKPRKQANHGTTGLIVEWSDVDPLKDSTTAADLSDQRFDHRNSILRLHARQIWRLNMDRLMNGKARRWLVTITAVFYYPECDTDATETRELEATCRFGDLNEHADAAIEEVMRHGRADAFVKVLFRAEVLS